MEAKKPVSGGSEAATAVENVSKSYSAASALRDVSFSVRPGELFGLIGPDGAGKTTLFEILVTLLLADSGTVTVSGRDVVRDYRFLRRHIGYMPGRFSPYPDLTVRENLQFFATVFGTTLEANYSLVKDIYDQLAPFEARRAGALSGGMKQKLALCCALIHKPNVLFLDEPTTGVDPIARRQFWDLIYGAADRGTTVFVTTHYMDEAEYCHRVSIMVDGKIQALDTPGGLKKTYGVDTMDGVFQILARGTSTK